MTESKSHASGMIGRLASLSPALGQAMRRYIESDSFVPGLDYVDAGTLAAAIADLGSSNLELVAFFRSLDELLLEATPGQRNLLVVGLLEGIQGQTLNRGQNLDTWSPLLGPIAAQYWQAISAVWHGEMSSGDFNHLVESRIDE